jgi:predicted DNA repair protein MutK
MAGASLLALLDDIAAMMDDVSLMTKVAVRKTAGVLGDDLAVNAEKVSGVRADRELQVVWSVAKGSFRNKLILVPAALLLAAFLPWAINPLLMLGGLFLCYEGFEKVFHAWVHRGESKKALELTPEELADPSFEQNKIQGAIRTDFILSAEIIVISLGTLATAEFSMQVMVLAVIIWRPDKVRAFFSICYAGPGCACWTSPRD